MHHNMCVQFFEHGTYEQRKELAGQLSKQMLPLSMQMYGCRVIQKVCANSYPSMLNGLLLSAFK